MTATNAEIEARVELLVTEEAAAAEKLLKGVAEEAEMKLRAFGESISAIYKYKYEVDEDVVAEEEAAFPRARADVSPEDATIEVGSRVTVEGFSYFNDGAIVTKIFADRSVSVAYDDGSTWSHVWINPRDRDIYIDEKCKSHEEKYKELEEKCNVLVEENINKQDKINAVKKWLDTYDIVGYCMFIGKELFDILTD